MAKIALLAGAAAGYVLGARAGRERYDQIEQKARTVLEDPRVQKVTRRASEAADRTADDAAAAADRKLEDVGSSTPTSTRTDDEPRDVLPTGTTPSSHRG